jgi:hypothetical protein
MSADGRHGCATVGVWSWVDALERRTRVRNNPERAVLALHDLAQLLLAILSTDAQDERLGTHQRNERVHIHLQRISIIVCPYDHRTPDVEQKVSFLASTQTLRGRVLIDPAWVILNYAA